MIDRHDLTDSEWALLEVLLPDRPGRVLADKAYSNKAIRATLRRCGTLATIPEPSDRQRQGTVDVASIRLWLRDPV